MLSFLPPDVALVLSSAIRRGRTAELSVERPGQRASAEDYGTALALIARYADHLASMPPPQDQKDDVGYSAATDRPMREYLEQVGEFGAESLPAETHFRAASMLLIHGKKQLPGDEIRALRDVIKTHIEREGRTAPPEKGAGAYAVADPKQGNVKNQGTYTWGRPRGAQNTLYIHLSPTLWKAGIRVGDILQAAGLERRVHWDFHKEPGVYADTTYLAIPAAHISKVMSALREVIPDLSTEILANLPLYRKMAGLPGQEEARPAPRRAPETAAPPPTPAAQTYDARKGEVALPRPPGRDWFLPAWKPFSWSWNPDEPETAMLGIPAAWWSPDRVKIPVHGKAIGDANVVVRRGPPPDYLTEVPVDQIPALAAALAGVRGGIYAEAVPLLERLHQMWVGAAHQAESERRASVTGDEVRLATRLARRFKHTVAEGITEAELRDSLINSIDILRRVLPGDLSADAGVHGSWVVRAVREEVRKKDLTINHIIREYVGLKVPYERGSRALLEAVGVKGEKTPTGWVSWIPMRKVSAACRVLDRVNPVIAMTLRLALLTDADVKVCHELDVLARSFKLDEIPDDTVAEQVRRLAARADLRARRKDADGNIVEMRPFEYQTIGMAYAHFAGGRALIGDAMGLGKAQVKSAKILTPTGWTTFGTIQVGDAIVGQDGRAHRVTGVFPRGKLATFRVTFSDGSSTVCSDDHLWCVNTASRRHRRQPPSVLPLSSIRQQLRDKAGNCRHFIPMVAPVQFEETPLPLDPYLLGYLLGNGNLSSPHRVAISIPDTETWDRLRTRLPAGSTLVFDSRINYRVNGSVLAHQLQALGLAGKKSTEKSIPEMYQYASIQSRVALLQGLLDSDGYAGAGKNIEYTSSSLELATQVRQLVWSLGGTASFATKERPTYTYKGEKRVGLPNHRLNIVLPPSIPPFLLSRKADALPPREKYGPSRAIVDVQPLEAEEVICIAVDAPDHLYVTDDYIVTHNTLQAIGYAKLHPEAFPALVVAPSNATFVWKAEFERWIPGVDAVVVEELKDPIPAPGTRSVRIFTYEMFRRRIEELLRLNFKLGIFDESHYLKHNTSGRSVAAGRLARAIPHILLLSGTSMENRIPELWHQLHMLDPDAFPSFGAFERKYASKNKRVVSVKDVRGDPEVAALLDDTRDEHGAIVREFDEDRQKASIEELTDALRCFMVRRTKQEVLTDLPEKTRKVLRLQGLDLSAYKLAEREMPALLAGLERRLRARAVAKLLLDSPNTDHWRWRMAELNEQPFTNAAQYVLVQLGRLREMVGAAKVGAAVTWIRDFLRRTGRPLLVFAEHGEVIRGMADALKAAGITHRVVTGETSSRKKSEAVNDFQDGKYEVLVASRALREAVTLHRAADVLFVEWWWVPAQMEQAEDRVYRIGQTKNVTIYFLSAPDTIDDDMAEMVEKKRKLVEEVIGADEYEEDQEKRAIAESDAAAAEVGANLLARMRERVRDSTGVKITEADVMAARQTLLDERVTGELKKNGRKRTS